jgi:hypothetical protein
VHSSQARSQITSSSRQADKARNSDTNAVRQAEQIHARNHGEDGVGKGESNSMQRSS